MKFWRRLRWIATAVFLLLLIGTWLGTDPESSHNCGPDCVIRPAPKF